MLETAEVKEQPVIIDRRDPPGILKIPEIVNVSIRQAAEQKICAVGNS